MADDAASAVQWIHLCTLPVVSGRKLSCDKTAGTCAVKARRTRETRDEGTVSVDGHTGTPVQHAHTVRPCLAAGAIHGAVHPLLRRVVQHALQRLAAQQGPQTYICPTSYISV